jgi:UDP-N-acetylmuramyl pentapeptide synthase
MEVEGKTIRETIHKLLQEINKKVEGKNFLENFSTKFEVKGRDMKELIENFSRKIVNYFEKKKAIFESLEAEIIPGKKWVLKVSLSGKIFESITKNFKEIRVLELEETVEGWKLSFSME